MAVSPPTKDKTKAVKPVSLFSLTPGKQQQLHQQQQQLQRRMQQQQTQIGPANKPRSVLKRNFVLMPHPLYAPNASSGDGLRAVFLTGPQPNSKRYLTALTHELQPLLNKAATLFPPPPGFKRPYLTLGHDPNSRLLEDAIPFLRDREVIVLRWGAPETPRIDRNVRWDTSVAADRTREDADARQLQFRKGKEGRAAHVQRVLQEQREIAAAEEKAAKSTSEAGTSTADDEAVPQRASTPVPAAVASTPSPEPAAEAVETSKEAIVPEPTTQDTGEAEEDVAMLDATASNASVDAAVRPPDASASQDLASEAAAFDTVASEAISLVAATPDAAGSALPTDTEVAVAPSSPLQAVSAPPSVSVITAPTDVEKDSSALVAADTIPPSAAPALRAPAGADVISASDTNAPSDAALEASSTSDTTEPPAVELSSSEAAATAEDAAAPESSPVAPDSSPSRRVLVAQAKSALSAESGAASSTVVPAPSKQHTRTKKLVSLDHIPLLPKDKLVDFIYEEIVSLMAKVWQNSSSGFLRMEFPSLFVQSMATTKSSLLDWRTLGNDVYVRAYGHDPSCILQKFARDFCAVWPSWGVFFSWLDANKECGWSAKEIEQFREDLKVIEPFARQCLDQSYLKVKQYVVRYLRSVDEGVNVTPRSGTVRVKSAASESSGTPVSPTSGASHAPNAASAALESAGGAWSVTKEQWLASIVDSPRSRAKDEQASGLLKGRAQAPSQEAPESVHDLATLSKDLKQLPRFSSTAPSSRDHATETRSGMKRKAMHEPEAVAEAARESRSIEQGTQFQRPIATSRKSGQQDAPAWPAKRLFADRYEGLLPATPKKRRVGAHKKEQIVAAVETPSTSIVRRSTRVSRNVPCGPVAPLPARVAAAAPPAASASAPAPAPAATSPARRYIAEVVVPMCDEEEELAVEALIMSPRDRDLSEELSSSRSSSLSSGSEWSENEYEPVKAVSSMQIMRPMSRRTALVASPYPKRKPSSATAAASTSRRA